MSVSQSLHGPRILGLLLFSCLAGAARAQGPAPAHLTFEEALRRSSEQNPSLLAERFNERAASALAEQAAQRPNPVLDLSLENFVGTGNLQGVRGLEATVQASQTLERRGKREKRQSLAKEEQNVAAREFDAKRAEVLGAAATLYLQGLAAQQRVAFAAEPLRLARDTVTAVEQRVKAAVGSQAEAARARAALAVAYADFTRAQGSLIQARAALAATWGGTADDVPGFAGNLSLPTTLPGKESYLAKLDQHPRLALQEAVISGRRAALQLEQAHAAQDVTVGGGVRFLREGNDAAFVTGFSIPLPFRNQNQGNIRAARETLSGAVQTLESVKASLRSECDDAWQQLDLAHATALQLRQQALPATLEAHAAVRTAYEQGILPLLELFDAQRALIALQREIFDAEVAFALALARLESLTNPSFTTLRAQLGRD